MQNKKTPEQALETLQFICAKMERCPFDVRRSLWRWGVDKEHYQSIIEKLETDKYVDQRRYAAAFVREKLSAGRWGESKIIAGLRAKAIDRDVIEDIVAELLQETNFEDRLESQLRARLEQERAKAKSEYDLRARLFRLGASRGYDFEQINRVLDKLLKDNYL